MPAYFPPHILKPNEQGELPRNFAFLDLETKPVELGGGVIAQRFHLGYLATVRRPDNVAAAWKPDYTLLTSLDTLYDTLDTAIRGREAWYLYAHNADFDTQAGDLIAGLCSRGWALSFLVTEPHKFMLKFGKKSKRLWLLDTANLFPVPLATLAKSLGLEKGTVDFDTVDDAELAAYCKQDVAILVEAVRQWAIFVREHELGKFSLTLASQAFAAYRHRFMTHPVYIHTRPAAIALERAAYFGGRVECYRIGELPTQTYYMLDVNSLYPYIMQTSSFPIKYAGILVRPTVNRVASLTGQYVVCAEVRVKTAKPLVPYRTKQDLLWPTGTFDTVLIGEELVEALRQGIVKRVATATYYEHAPIFADYVKELYQKRLDFAAQDNPAFAYFCKTLLNSLYGKFGQRARGWVKLGTCAPDRIEFTRWLDTGGQSYSVRYLGGVVEALLDMGNSRNSFVAIAACVTAAARMHLWRLMQTVPAQHLYYVDTDSLLVDQIGMNALAPHMSDSGELGKLKLEKVADRVEIRGPKSYTFGDTVKEKGVPQDATQVGPNAFEYLQWQRINGAVHEGVSGEVRQRKVVKLLARHYKKGHVTYEGWVEPYELSPLLPLASLLLHLPSWPQLLLSVASRLRALIFGDQEPQETSFPP